MIVWPQQLFFWHVWITSPAAERYFVTRHEESHWHSSSETLGEDTRREKMESHFIKLNCTSTTHWVSPVQTLELCKSLALLDLFGQALPWHNKWCFFYLAYCIQDIFFVIYHLYFYSYNFQAIFSSFFIQWKSFDRVNSLHTDIKFNTNEPFIKLLTVSTYRNMFIYNVFVLNLLLWFLLFCWGDDY